MKTGSDFSGVGAFDQALIKLGIDYKTVYACDWDKYSRQTYIHNYGEPDYYPEDVYDREIPSEPLDIYMTSPPCQAFSLAGKRKGETDERGILFYNSHEFIVKNKPRYFIFENVKGLLSDDNGKTFQRWIDHLAGKSVNGNPVIFPLDNSTPYHVYYQVLNAKHYGIPQNRERVFIVGIRDDADNNFCFPKPFPLEKRLKDVLEDKVDEKYFLSNKMLNYFNTRVSNFNNGNINYKDENSVASTITSSCKSLDISDNIINLGNTNPSGNGMNENVFSDKGVSPTLSTNKGEGIKVSIAAIKGRNPKDPSDRTTGAPMEQRLEINQNGTSNTLTSVKKDNVVVFEERKDTGMRFFKDGCCGTIRTISDGKDKRILNKTTQRIRRLTPRECFRLMDFPDTFTWSVSNSQAYKQAGNSIVVNVLAEIIKKLNL